MTPLPPATTTHPPRSRHAIAWTAARAMRRCRTIVMPALHPLGSLTGTVALATAAVATLSLSLVGGASARAARTTATSACGSSALVVWLDTAPNGTAGTIYYTLKYTNLSRRACTLGGYPGVSAIGLNGRQLGSPASRVRLARPRTVRLASGATASSSLGIVEAGAIDGCRIVSAAGLRVFAPNQTRSQRIPFPFQACASGRVLRAGPVT